VIEVPSNYPYYGCPGDTQLAVVTTEPKEPPKDAELKGPRAPRRGGERDGVELSAPTDKRRRAETGALPPRRTRAVTHGRSGEVRYSGDRRSAGSRDASSRGASSNGGASSTAGSSGSAQGSEQVEPMSKPAPERGGESGKARKP
jgi:hypothetical protein